MRSKKVLSEDYVEKLYEIFEAKKWDAEEPGKFSVFDRFCDRLAFLTDDEERDLLIELTRRFVWVQANQYEAKLVSVLKSLFESPEWCETNVKGATYICPLVSEVNFGKTKSSTFMLYLCQSIMLRTFDEFQNKQVRICETPKVLQHHKDNVGRLILLDDYVGSGETAMECLTYLEKLGITAENIPMYVVTIVTQEEGMKWIEGQGVRVYSDTIRKKGISDYYSSEEVPGKLAVMERIEKLLRVEEKERFGHLQSESLVSMIRTPNNTFPVYWMENQKTSKAPFPRKKNVKFLGIDKEE